MICSNCKANCSDDSLYCAKCGNSLIGSDMQITRNDFTHELKNNRSLNFKSGEKFGDRYEIIRELGKGGMGQVFKAHDNVLGIDVALKMIRPEFLMNKKMISRFKQEILLAREITHENVSRIHDFGDVDGIKFISMEFISGRTLKDIVRQDGPVEIERAIEISKAICGGLSAAHRKEIIHRDLKPQNIMIDDDGHVFITDFGLAKSVREENVSHTGLVIGTPQYIPPELWKGEVADQRSDIYSLGIIIYEMVAGEELFQSDSDYGYLQKHVNEEPEFPPPVKDKLPSFFRQLILRCLAKEREARYQDCGQIYRDLKDRMFSKGTFISEVERSIKRTGPRKIALGIIFILIISFIGSLILEKGPPKQKKRSVAILYFKNLSGMPSLDHFSYSLPELLTTDLGQSKYIKVLPEDKVSKVLKESNYLSSAFIDEKMFEKLGDQANVNYLVQGSFIKSGNDLRITVKLRDSDTGEMLSTDYQDATMDNIFPAVDRLTTGLKKRFNLTENEIFADIDSEIQSITTSSQEALNHYITGKRLFNEGKTKKSLIEYQKAIDVDPEFAMAYRAIAWSHAMLLQWDKRKENFEKTLKYIDRLSEKEKYLILGSYYAESSGTYKKSIEYFEKVLKIYPDNYQANYNIGMLYRVTEEWDKALQYAEKALEEEKNSIYSLNEVVYCYMNTGEIKKGEAAVRKFREENGQAHLDKVLFNAYRLKLAQNKYEDAENILKELQKLADHNKTCWKYNPGVIQILDEKYEKAEITYRTVLKDKNFSHYPYKKILKHLLLFQGKFDKFADIMNKEIDAASYIGNANEKLFRLFFINLSNGKTGSILSIIDKFKVKEGSTFEDILLTSLLAYYELSKGDLAKAAIQIKKMKKLSRDELPNKLYSRLIWRLEGAYYEKKKDIKKAKEQYLKSLSNIGKMDTEFETKYYFDAALFLYNQQEYTEAEKLFKKIHSLINGRLYRGDLYVRSFYYLGKIFQKKGLSEKAVKSFQTFYNMWKDGDSEFVKEYIDDTKIQLKVLNQKI